MSHRILDAHEVYAFTRCVRRAVSGIASPGNVSVDGSIDGYPNRESFIPGRNNGFSSKPKGAAQCASSARWDLRGGRAHGFAVYAGPVPTEPE